MPACVSEPSRQQVQTYFNSITRRYDILNAVLSLGLDRSWRTKAVKALLTERTRRVLDVGTGTGSLVAEMLRQNPELEVAAIDVARDMLALAQEKIKNPRVAWQEASALELPFNEESFEGVITAFTLRSIQNLPPFLIRLIKY
jgi:demethylmenaquinone methyltransferase/2-methoxy-6-polyprenyl-1,4-benzoquinol methylase